MMLSPTRIWEGSFLKEGTVFAASRYLLTALSLGRNVVVARILGPGDFGNWVILSVILTLGDHVHLGLRHAGEREIPFLRGSGEQEASGHLADQVLGATILIAAACFVFGGMSAVLVGSSDSTLLSALPLVGAVIGLEQLNRYYLMILRTNSEFMALGRIESSIEAVRTVVVILLVVRWGIPGLVAGLVLSSCLLLAFFLRRFYRTMHPTLEFARFLSLLRLGIPIFLVTLLFALLLNLDRVFGSFLFDRASLGIYGVAALVAQLPLGFSQAIASVVYPTFNEEFGRTGSAASLSGSLAKALTTITLIVPLIAGTFYFGAKALFLTVLPAYDAASGILAVMLPGVFIVSCVPVFAGVFTALKRERLFLVLLIVGLIVTLLFLTVVPALSANTLQAMALAMSAGLIVCSILVQVWAFRLLGCDVMQFFRDTAIMYLPIMYGLVVLFGVSSFLLTSDSLGSVAGGYGLFFLLYVPFVMMRFGKPVFF